MWVSECRHAHGNSGSCKVQKGMSNCIEQELQAVINYPTEGECWEFNLDNIE